MKKANLLKIAMMASLILAGCSSKKADGTTSAATDEDSSSSGLVASAIGGAIASSSSSGTVASFAPQPSIWSVLLPQAFASTACPTLRTTNGSGCDTHSGYVDLTYSSCSFGSSLATWSGTLEVSLGSGSISCGTFPSGLTSNTVVRQFVSLPGVPGGIGVRGTKRGTVVYIDHATADLGNYDGVTIAKDIGTGYGTKVTFNSSGARSAVDVKQRLYVTGGFDHSVVGSISLSESGSTRAASGTMTVYHNKAKVIGTSTLSAVTYNDTSCVPVSGTITTVFTAGTVQPTVIGNLMVGKSETLVFNSDGTASFTDTSGTTSTVELTHCY